jgi:hypothetical protein
MLSDDFLGFFVVSECPIDPLVTLTQGTPLQGHLSGKDVRETIHDLSFSVKDDVQCGRRAASLEDVVNGDNVANSSLLIGALRNGYKTQIQQNNFTGEHKQRIEVARRIPILLVDKATPALYIEWTASAESVGNCWKRKTAILVMVHERSLPQNARADQKYNGYADSVSLEHRIHPPRDTWPSPASSESSMSSALLPPTNSRSCELRCSGIVHETDTYRVSRCDVFVRKANDREWDIETSTPAETRELLQTPSIELSSDAQPTSHKSTMLPTYCYAQSWVRG